MSIKNIFRFYYFCIFIMYHLYIYVWVCLFVSIGKTSEMFSQWQRNTYRLWTGKPTPKRCWSEYHSSVWVCITIYMHNIVAILLFSGYILCHTYNDRHLTEYKRGQRHPTTWNVSRLIRVESSLGSVCCMWLWIKLFSYSCDAEQVCRLYIQ